MSRIQRDEAGIGGFTMWKRRGGANRQPGFIDGEDDLSYKRLCHQSGQGVYFENGAGI